MTVTVAPATRYEIVIGVEIHVQLKTASKMFCACSTDVRGAAPNTLTCPVCLGLPGALPVINRRAVEHVLATGLAIGGQIPEFTRWDRKNYFYPDLPKGYQISQYDLPLTSGGSLAIETSDGPFSVGITRAHLEEDTARLLHQDADGGGRVSMVDFNRSGIPLMEIVTDPVIQSAEAARRYAEELRLLLLTIGASDAQMEEGQMRVEANVSLRPAGTETLGTRVEVKNMNSFRSVERAIAFEVDRQTHALDAGERLVQETRGWDDTRGETYTMRLKEESEDYRYFPEPDLPPLRTDAAMIAEIRARMPELPAARRARYSDALGLSLYDAGVLVGDARATALFEGVLAADPALPAKRVANWVTGEYLRVIKSGDGSGAGVDAGQLAWLIGEVESGALSNNNAKQVFERHAASGEPAADIVAELGLRQISDSGALGTAVDAVIAANPDAVADYRAGKEQAIRFLTGQVMKETRGQANAALVQQLLEERLRG
ncbi:MAG TPA: Asp-tRNA(Asn)/Glu-tRNA(Gln) amidotransferase subunit GatB [Candidatus Limnocylindrales bacterium]|nr:Asp-tRNA(Asn)/Glu-tRNA(Gln) amidotransferase subunit GatB [Candidatus Limnocylindrales bacterium]